MRGTKRRAKRLNSHYVINSRQLSSIRWRAYQFMDKRGRKFEITIP